MNSSVIIVGENASSMILSTLTDMLSKDGFNVNFSLPTVNDFGKIKTVADVLILYCGDYIKSSRETLVYINDYCIEHERKIMVVGYDTELEYVKSIISETRILKEYARPLNVKELISDLNEEIEIMIKGGERKRILVVDDSGIQQKLISSWLKDKFNVDVVGSAAAAISFLTQTRPDLILLDYEMPICSGPQFLEMIHTEVATSDIPVIFLTAMGDKASVQNVLALKPAGYLLKSMPPAKIVESIENFFEKNKLK